MIYMPKEATAKSRSVSARRSEFWLSISSLVSRMRDSAWAAAPMSNARWQNTVRLLEAARACDAPVANCYIAYGNDEECPHWKVGAVKTDLRRGGEGVELDPRIADHSYDYVFEKWGASAFFMTPLSSFFTRHQVDTVAVTGCVTSGCVRASVVDAFQFGFRALLVEDCCGDQEEGPHNDTLRDVGRRYADIVSADEVIERLKLNGGRDKVAITPQPPKQSKSQQ